MAKVYISAAHVINEKPYRLLVPRSYQPNMPQDFITGKVKPFISYEYASEPQIARYPIKYMIDMCDTKVRFTILEDEDVCDIFDVVDDYLISIKHDIAQGYPEILAYAKRVLNFREELFKKFFYVCNKHYELRRRYYHNKKDNRCFESFMAAMAITSDGARHNEIDTDPISMMRYPPVKIPDATTTVQPTITKETKTNSKVNRGLARDDDDEAMSIVDTFMQ